MSSFWTSITSCCGSSTKDETGTENERTALLNPDILPQAPIQTIGKSTEDQLAEQDALRSIFTQAADRFVDIESSSPFSRSQSSPYSSRSVSPASYDSRLPLNSTSNNNNNNNNIIIINNNNNNNNNKDQIRTSMWRPPNGDSPIKVIHLGTHFEPHTSSTSKNDDNYPSGRGGGVGMRPPSSHSLRTITKSTSGMKGRLSPFNSRTNSSNFNKDNVDDRSEGDGDGESLYGTMTSYKTAREDNGTVIEGAFRSGEGDARTALKDIWNRGGENGVVEGQTGEITPIEGEVVDIAQRQTEREHEEEQFAIRLKEIEDSMIDFKLIMTEPIVYDLDAERS